MAVFGEPTMEETRRRGEAIKRIRFHLSDGFLNSSFSLSLSLPLPLYLFILSICRLAALIDFFLHHSTYPLSRPKSVDKLSRPSTLGWCSLVLTTRWRVSKPMSNDHDRLITLEKKATANNPIRTSTAVANKSLKIGATNKQG